MISPRGYNPSLAKSGTFYVPGVIPLVKARTLSMTVKVKFNASATAGVSMNVFYSPDGSSYDTDVYATETIAVSAGNTRQETMIVDPPEHGYIKFTVINLDASYGVTAVTVWYSIQSWEFYGGIQKGDVRTDEGEENPKPRRKKRRNKNVKNTA